MRILRQWMILMMLWPAALPAAAAVERECIVSVRVASGWSVEHRRRVHYLTGLEFTRITRMPRIEFHQHYAMIWSNADLPTVARLDGVLLGVGREFSDADFERLFARATERHATQLEGEGQGLTWRIRSCVAGSAG
ncbi:MAG: hypothetical protein AB7E73_14720 [Burkholderiales bacterium]